MSAYEGYQRKSIAPASGRGTAWWLAGEDGVISGTLPAKRRQLPVLWIVLVILGLGIAAIEVLKAWPYLPALYGGLVLAAGALVKIEQRRRPDAPKITFELTQPRAARVDDEWPWPLWTPTP